jgi:hypothetical protein
MRANEKPVIRFYVNANDTRIDYQNARVVEISYLAISIPN